MFDGKKKAITLSYDDGVTQDIRFIELLNKYNLKATFNLNSSYLGLPGEIGGFDRKINHSKNKAEDIRSIYQGHEVAVHTLTHPSLPTLEDSVVTRQVEEDRLILSELVGYEVVGMAYPGGGINNDDRVARVIKETTGVKYARTIASTHNFDLPDNLYRLDGTIFHLKTDEMFELGKRFVELKSDTPQIFYIWGHSYEFDGGYSTNWETIEEFFRLIANRDDIFYGTNKDVFLQA